MYTQPPYKKIMLILDNSAKPQNTFNVYILKLKLNFGKDHNYIKYTLDKFQFR